MHPYRRARPLKAVPELGPHEIHVSQLSTVHVGLIVALRRGRNTLTGPLDGVPVPSMTKPLLVLRVGTFSAAMHPADTVLVVPTGYTATIVIGPDPAPARPPLER